MRSTSQLNIKNPEAYRLATQLAELTGETLTYAVTKALQERLDREQKCRRKTGAAARLLALADEFAGLPVLDPREPDEMLYDEDGLPR